MNMYKFEDLMIGKRETFEYIVTEEKMDMFRELTGDNNSLHQEESFAVEHGYNGRVVYGMLSAALLSTLGGVYLPGQFCLIQQMECKFVAPVYIGDKLCVKGEVCELHESVRRATIKVEIHNQNQKKVLKGRLFVGFLE